MKKLLIVLALLISATAVSAQEPTATPLPIPTPANLQGERANELLGEADGELDSVPRDLGGIVPDEDGQALYGYAKWLLSPSIAYELLDPLAPIAVHAGVYISMSLLLGGIYVAIYVIIYIVRWVVWLINLMLKIVTAVASAVNGIIGAAGGVLGKVVSIFR